MALSVCPLARTMEFQNVMSTIPLWFCSALRLQLGRLAPQRAHQPRDDVAASRLWRDVTNSAAATRRVRREVRMAIA